MLLEFLGIVLARHGSFGQFLLQQSRQGLGGTAGSQTRPRGRRLHTERQLGLSAAEAGLTAGLSDLLPPPPDPDEWAYNNLGTDSSSCMGRDLRFSCGGQSAAANHTETEYIGVTVHEIRVTTVAAARPRVMRRDSSQQLSGQQSRRLGSTLRTERRC